MRCPSLATPVDMALVKEAKEEPWTLYGGLGPEENGGEGQYSS